jgi:protein SCO1/2
MTSMRFSARLLLLLVLLPLVPASADLRAQAKATQYAMRGMVLAIDAAHHSVVISHDAITGVMPSMAMPFDVRQQKELSGLAPGAIVTFTLVIAPSSSHIERVHVVRYESVEQDPLAARRLRLLQQMTARRGCKTGVQDEGARRGCETRVRAAAAPLTVGQPVPDFTLTDQAHARVSLSQFRGMVVALNFVYTSCVLPQFCYRMANYFGVMQKRFTDRVGRDLVLLTVTFDPARDTPERLAEYGRQFDADPRAWHFLTGSPSEVQRVTSQFGLDAFPDEGLFSHSTRTVLIDRRGVLAASIEGNQFTATQLGDLIATQLR